MTICRDWSLVKHTPEARYARPLYCRSWSCEECRPRRKRQLMALAAAGNATRFLTLTVNPRYGSDPHERLLALTDAWRVCVKRLRRRYGTRSINYLAIVEETQQGEPHLHILLRSPYIPQELISQIMGELIQSPIVDIRRIRGAREVIRYIAKYITKAPAQFGNAKRYFHTADWEGPADTKSEADTPEGVPWQIERRAVFELIRDWIMDGYVPRRDRGDLTIGLPVFNPPLYRPD